MNNRLKLCVLLVITLAFSAVLFLLSYYGDNKYTAVGPQPLAGVLVLTEQELEENNFVYLIDDWEIFRDRLLTPEDFQTQLLLPDEYVFIGQYGGFEGHSGSHSSPHGSATYRLNISVSGAPDFYSLEIPEIYSAYRIYINGMLAEQMVEPSPDGYYAETGMRRLSFYAANRIEIVVQVTDYDHFYSDMVYPSAFGKAAFVDRVLGMRLAIRTAAIVLAVVVGLFYTAVWLILRLNKNHTLNLALYYAALCAFYALYISYPVIKTFFDVSSLWYKIEALSLPLLLLVITGVQLRITDISGLAAKIMCILGIFVCFWSLCVPLAMGDSLLLMIAHSRFIAAYCWICAAFLLLSSARCVLRGVSHSNIVLAGSVIFGASLLMDRLLPLFEPIYFGWFSEIAGGFYVIAISGVMASSVAAD